jgi:hypothetical protein
LIKQAPSSSANIIDEFSQRYPLHEMYRFFNRFFVSGKENFSGWLPGEQTEPGFLIGCIYAFMFELDNLDVPLSVEVIDRIHHHVIDGVLDTNYTPGEIQSGLASYRKPGDYVGFGLIPGQNISKKGLEELKSTTPNQYQYSLIKQAIGTTGNHYFKLGCFSDHSPSDTHHILENYHQMIDGLSSRAQHAGPKQIIKAICQMVSDLERLHPYGDGNCRTFGLILLNRELVRHGLVPTMMDDPNQFDGFAHEELVAKVIEGQQRYQEILDNHGLEQTPFRSPHVFLKSSGERIPKGQLGRYNLVDMDLFDIRDEMEFGADGKPFNGEPQTDVEQVIHRLLVETALKKIHAHHPSHISTTLIDRLGGGVEENTLNPTEGHSVRLFYSDMLAHVFASLPIESRLNLLKASLRFGGQSVVQLMPEILRNSEEPFTEYKFLLSSGQTQSLIAYCLGIERPAIAQDFLSLGVALEPIEQCLHEDIQSALAQDDYLSLGRYAQFIAQNEGLFSMNRELVLALAAVSLCHQQIQEKCSQQANKPSLSGMLVLLSIKTDPLIEVQRLTKAIASHLVDDRGQRMSVNDFFKDCSSSLTQMAKAHMDELSAPRKPVSKNRV